jgi:outer membrane scaffolding protein for murein synthesis (MipA/OmpV family)
LLIKQGEKLMRRLACIALATASCIASPALAQSAPPSAELPKPEELSNRDMFTVAVGVGYTPDYEGSDDYRIIPAAAIRGQVSGINFSTEGTYLYVDVFPKTSSNYDFLIGPVVGARLNRTRKIDDDIVRLLPEKKTAIELGGYAGVSFSGLTNPYDSLAVKVAAVHDVADAHQSTVIMPEVSFSTPLSRRTYASLSLGGEWVTNKFADYYFSVTPADSLLTGGALPVFDADGGMKNWKAGLMVNQSITGDLLGGFSLFGMANYSRLMGDFKRSPLVSQRGSASQWLLATGVAYTW